jgi:hypothetical protein
MTRLEVRNLPAKEIAAYLVEEMGGAGDHATVTGDGWIVRLVRGETASVGRFRVPVLFIDIEGEREDEIARFVRQRTMRGGG